MNKIIRLGLAVSCAAMPARAQDTVRVRADNPPAWGTSVRLIKEYTVGTLTDPAENASGAIDNMASLPSGVFFVFDPKDTVIRRYDANGKFTGKVGRGGAGPGEYRTVDAMTALNDTTLIACDGTLMRITFFNAAGKLLGSIAKPSGTVTVSGCNVLPAAGGTLRVEAARLEPGPPPAPGTRPRIQRIWVRLRPNGTVVDTALIPSPTRHLQFALMTSDGARPSFGDDPLTAPHVNGGTVTAWPRAYRIAVPQPTGRVLLIERTYRPIPIVGEERTEWLAQADRFNKPPAPQPGIIPPSVSYGPYVIPDTKPALRDVTSDNLGRLWVDVYTTATKRVLQPLPPPPPGRAAPPPSPRLTWREPSVYDVIDASGKFLGRVELPEQAQLESIQRNRIWLRTKGPDGEDLITAYRLQGTGGP